MFISNGFIGEGTIGQAPSGGVASTTEDFYGGSISGFTYSTKNSGALDETIAHGIHLSFDGSRMFNCGDTLDGVGQYDMSTPWDISTVGVSTGFLDTSSETTTPRGIDFKKDGSILYVVQNSGTIFQYSADTENDNWDVDNFSYDSKSYNPTEVGNGAGLAVSFDGTKMWVLSGSNDTIYQYTLSTPYDVSTSSYDTVSFSGASQDLTPQDINVSPDGTKLWITGNTGNAVDQYTMGSANQLTGTTYDSVLVSVSSQEGTPRAAWVGNGSSGSGLDMYVIGNNDIVYQYN